MRIISDKDWVRDMINSGRLDAWVNAVCSRFPLDLLDTEDFDKWMFTAGDRYRVKEQTLDLISAGEDGIYYESEEAFRALNPRAEGPAVPGAIQLTLFAVWDMEYNREDDTEGEVMIYTGIAYTDSRGRTRQRYMSRFEFEDDAEAHVSSMNDTHRQKADGGLWANNWVYLFSSSISDEDLFEAGFSVAYYTPSGGREFRLAGIDGGGYSFQEAHYWKLYIRLDHPNYGDSCLYEVELTTGEKVMVCSGPVPDTPEGVLLLWDKHTKESGG